MAGYLEDYGVEEERRGKAVRRIVVLLVVLVIVALVLYFTLRSYPAKSRVRAFLEDLRKHDYQTAYRLWGCAAPCRDYPFDKFMEDWGPKSEFADTSAAKIRRVRYCDTGSIITLSPAKGSDVNLWYQRSNGTLGFAPWPVCSPHIPPPAP